jgi:deazaflavin-dependent oxidoreductase (nitroreductase family)
VPDGDGLIVIASNWGQAHYPAWYHNVRAHPKVQVTHAGQTTRYTAEELRGAARDRCWQLAVKLYHGYALYAARTQGRPIPVIRLAPETEQ